MAKLEHNAIAVCDGDAGADTRIAHGCTRAAHVARLDARGGDGQPDVRIDEQSEVRGADLDMLRAGRDTVDTCLPVHHPVVAAVDAGERHPYRPLGVERFQAAVASAASAESNARAAMVCIGPPMIGLPKRTTPST